jgi:hypothetical protein
MFKSSILILIAYFSSISNQNQIFSNSNWNDLRITWGTNPFSPTTFVGLPLTEKDALDKGWKKEKGCSDGIKGNRYILNNDRGVILIFNADGKVSGLAASIPKGLPFNFPSKKIQEYINEEDKEYIINAYFMDPEKACERNQINGDRFVIHSNKKSIVLNSLKENELDLSKWTRGQCYFTMGAHYWLSLNKNNNKVSYDTHPDDFFPIFLQFNNYKFNGFGWAFNFNITSNRFERFKPTNAGLTPFFREVPKFFTNPEQADGVSTLHVYLQQNPELSYC